MRLYQKKQCLEIIRFLEESRKKIAGYMEKGKAEEAQDLLGQCQQSALRVGTLVENAQGEGTETAQNLERYCEMLFQLYTKLTSGVSVNEKQISQMLQSPLKAVKHSLRYEIDTQIEAVFLPYKASMWDSLESVWRAAQEDPVCTAIVIPIPYFDRNPDGSPGTMHCDAELFPADVPVVSYDDYDFDVRHPDMIFIHNSYDDGNYATSVHPFFYSRNLKQYTDELVYIPYFVQNEIDPEDEAAVREMEHLYTTSGMVNADHVIVQSEAMRRIYVDVLTKYTGEDLRPLWEKKVLGLGSPKFDRVRSLRPEDFELSASWKARIQRADGSRKKVIFYNTTISAVLKDGGAMLDKIERTLGMFRKNRTEVILLWRPHPLMEATVASMCPELLERYRRIVEEYREADWGIYDDSADLNRAIAVSDAYYGDWSSVVWLYRETGKPIMIQTVDV